MPLTMLDSVNPQALKRVASTSFEAVAGYAGGSWPDYGQMCALFPHDHHLSIAVNAGEDADCLDVERGDATPIQAPDWCRRQHGRGVRRPVLYASLSVMPQVKQALSGAGIPRTAYRLWVADYIYTPPHSLGEFDAWQWTDHFQGQNIDASLVADDFFGPVAQPPAPKKKRKLHIPRPKVKRPKLHRKVIGSTAGGAVAAIILFALGQDGVHVSPDLAKLIQAVSVLVAGYMTPAEQATVEAAAPK